MSSSLIQSPWNLSKFVAWQEGQIFVSDWRLWSSHWCFNVLHEHFALQYAENNRELALLSINSFQKDCHCIASVAWTLSVNVIWKSDAKSCHTAGWTCKSYCSTYLNHYCKVKSWEAKKHLESRTYCLQEPSRSRKYIIILYYLVIFSMFYKLSCISQGHLSNTHPWSFPDWGNPGFHPTYPAHPWSSGPRRRGPVRSKSTSASQCFEGHGLH